MSDLALDIARDHPAYEGHFPGHPILPAVVLLGEALAAAQRVTGTAAADWTVSQAKFQRAVEPGTALTLALETIDGGGFKFEIHSPGGAVATGTLARSARTA